MLTGKRLAEDMFSDGLNLHKLSKVALPEGVMEIADSNLINEESDEGRMKHFLTSIARIGVACSEESASNRMGIKDVVIQLNIIKEVYVGAGISHGERPIRMQSVMNGSSQEVAEH